MWKSMTNIRLKDTSLKQLRKIAKKQKAKYCLMHKWVINVEDFKDLFENSFTKWILEIVWTSRKDLEKYLGLSESKIQDWENLYK